VYISTHTYTTLFVGRHESETSRGQVLTKQHIATRCNTWHYTHFTIRHHSAPHGTILHHTAPHCTTLHNAALHNTTPQCITTASFIYMYIYMYTATHCNPLQHTTTQESCWWRTLSFSQEHIATSFAKCPKYAATHSTCAIATQCVTMWCIVLQRVAVRCSMLQYHAVYTCTHAYTAPLAGRHQRAPSRGQVLIRLIARFYIISSIHPFAIRLVQFSKVSSMPIVLTIFARKLPFF